MAINPDLAEGQSYVDGRSEETARTLYLAADEAGVLDQLFTTSHGYIVPSGIVPSELDSKVSADFPAVPTEPGTSTNVEEVWNVGGAPTKKAESSDDKDVDPDVLAQLEAEKAAAAEAESEVSDPAAGEEEDLGGADLFDPAGATIADVKEYLDGADDTERERVLAAEAASEKPRKGVLDLAVTSEGA